MGTIQGNVEKVEMLFAKYPHLVVSDIVDVNGEVLEGMDLVEEMLKISIGERVDVLKAWNPLHLALFY